MRTDRILVAIDLAGSSTEVVQAAASLAEPLGAQVTLMTVVTPAAGVNPFGQRHPGERNDQVLDRDAFNDLEPYVALLERTGITVHKDLGHGAPAQAILSAIERHDPGIVVMGTHGRAGIDRWLKGSVCETVLRSTHVPVLVLHTEASGLDPTE